MTSFPTTIERLIMTNTQIYVLGIIVLTTWLALRQYLVKKPLQNLRGPPPQSFIKGNFMQLFDLNGWDYHKKILAQYGGVIRVKALFGEDQLYVSDLTALHHIIVKDQNIYEETANFFDLNRLMFGEGIFASHGAQHRRQRKLLTPVFSIAHLRPMIHIFRQVTEKLRNSFISKVTGGPQEIDILHWMTRTALELIGQSGFGYSFDHLTEDTTPHPYGVSAKSLMGVVFRLIIPVNYLLPIVHKIGTPRFQRFVVDWIPWKDMHEFRDIIDTLHNTSVEIVELKKKALADGDEALEDQIAKGKDIISILLRDNMNASTEDRLSDREIVGQITSLTFAAMDTTSGALTRTISLLCSHPEVQEKLRREILEARLSSGGDLSYDTLVALPYLDAVCRETLRVYPPVSMVRREAREAIILPLSQPIKGNDGRNIHEIYVPKGTGILVSLLAANCNPEIWGPDSYEWKPERWLSPLPDAVIKSANPGVYSHLMTFLGGGRACIGFKFSQLEMKVVLSMLLESLKFSTGEKEIYWQMAPMASPVVIGDESHPQLPTIVSLV